MRNIPQKIYLQINGDGYTPEDFKQLSGISWCEDKINENDIEYTLSTPSKVGEEEAVRCKCKDSHGSTSVMCCNDCGLPTEEFWTKRTTG